MPQVYQIDQNNFYNSVFNAIADYNQTQGYRPELCVISDVYGESVARAISAGLGIAVMIDEHTADDQFILTMLPEDNQS